MQPIVAYGEHVRHTCRVSKASLSVAEKVRDGVKDQAPFSDPTSVASRDLLQARPSAPRLNIPQAYACCLMHVDGTGRVLGADDANWRSTTFMAERDLPGVQRLATDPLANDHCQG